MGDMRPDGNKRTVTPVRAPPRSVQSQREHRRALVIVCLVAAITTAVVIAAESLIWGYSLHAPQVALAAPDSELQTARITKDLGSKGCSQEAFDNKTGRMTRSPQPCDATTYDSNGMPVPVGTIHRLDAISKSFSSH
jgi:hypothetical protein